jgi:phosphate acyltransferase
MRIAVDAMGGDHGCAAVVGGVKLALQTNSKIRELFLVGQKSEIEESIHRLGCPDPRIRIIHASEVLTMEDKPVVGLRKKRDCSIARAVELVKEGQAEALVSLGNTGGVVAAATIRLRTLPGVDRPAIATVIPAPENRFVLLDAGANVECRPTHLMQYALMGHVFARDILRIQKPRVGLLSVGTEDSKGNDLTLEAFKICQMVDMNFVGNVEGHDLFANRVDVVVCDGFVGNIVLKTCESLATGIFRWLKKELTQNPLRYFGAFLAQGAMRHIKQHVDPENQGGAPLLGLNGNVTIAHGSAREHAVMNAIRFTTEAVDYRINQAISREILAAQARIQADKPPTTSPSAIL